MTRPETPSPFRRRAALLSLLVLPLLAACGEDGPTATTDPSASATAPTPSASPGPVDPFTALAPPSSPGVGTFSALVANRAYAATQGFLALQLLERSTVTGGNDAALVDRLQGALQDPQVAEDLGDGPTRRGLDYRPLFGAGVELGTPLATVQDSQYVAEPVTGLGGEQGMRITWTGRLSYPVTVGSTASEVTYATSVSYIFGPVENDPNGIELQAALKGEATFTGVVEACTRQGVLYPGASGAACPAEATRTR
jgi:hypothetical protein